MMTVVEIGIAEKFPSAVYFTLDVSLLSRLVGGGGEGSCVATIASSCNGGDDGAACSAGAIGRRDGRRNAGFTRVY